MQSLESLGYKPTFFKENTDWPSEHWVKVASNGHWKQTFVFDTIHGGPWAFECHAVAFIYKDEENWTTQERIEFNPASHDFIGCNVGHWARTDAILDAAECRAVAEHITMLERERTSKFASGGIIEGHTHWAGDE